jgi:hypothetical protein
MRIWSTVSTIVTVLTTFGIICCLLKRLFEQWTIQFMYSAFEQLHACAFNMNIKHTI